MTEIYTREYIAALEKDIAKMKEELVNTQRMVDALYALVEPSETSDNVEEGAGEKGVPDAELAGEDDVVLTIETADGHTYKADLLCCFKAGDLNRDYCAVLSHETKPDGSNEIQLFRYSLADNGDGTETFEISDIPSDMEFEDARGEFEKMMDGATMAS